MRILAGDLWLASDAKNTRSSPGYVRHYIIDTSEAIIEVRNGTAAGPLEIHTCDLGPRGMFVVGLNRRAQ